MIANRHAAGDNLPFLEVPAPALCGGQGDFFSLFRGGQRSGSCAALGGFCAHADSVLPGAYGDRRGIAGRGCRKKRIDTFVADNKGIFCIGG